MPNKSEKMQNFKNTLIVFGLIVLFIGCFLLAVITPFAITLHDKVAYADSTDGVVENNLFEYNDFGEQGYWRPSSGFTSFSFTDLGFLYSTSSWCALEYLHDVGFLPNTTYTVAWYIENSSNNNEGSLHTFTFTVPASVETNNNYCVSSTMGGLSFRLYYNTSSGRDYLIPTFDWHTAAYGNGCILRVKLEKGSSFTGYVPKDYINYGYTQGYNDGTKDTLEVYNIVRGYTILGSTTQYLNDVVFAGKNYLSSPDPSLASTTIPNLPKLFSYNDIDYYLVKVSMPVVGTLFSFDANYLYHMIATTNVGYAAVPIGVDIVYTGNKKIYLCKDFTIAGTYNIIVRSSDGLNTIIIDTYTVDAYFSNVPVMDLSKYLSKGVSYNFYLSSKTVAETGSPSSFALDTHNTYFTGLNSLCIITIEDGDQIGQSSYEEGRKAGYSAGKQAGYWEGYSDGYSQGELVAPADGQYTFLGVIGALFDAPIGALSSFLNFDLLGFNMRSFFFALISLAFIILVLRIVLGSKL